MATTSKFVCPCCGFLTFEEQPPGTHNICPVCYWEDDIVQFKDPGYCCGANGVSLKEARENFTRFKASEERFKHLVRPPFSEEIP